MYDNQGKRERYSQGVEEIREGKGIKQEKRGKG